MAVGQPPTDWHVDLCGCCSDCGTCCKTFWCPCCTMGDVAGMLGDSCCCHCIGYFVPIVSCICMAQQRTKIRNQRNIIGNECADCCLACWCPMCVLCQNERELKIPQHVSAVASTTTVIVNQGPVPVVMAPQQAVYPSIPAVSQQPVAGTSVYPPQVGAGGYHQPMPKQYEALPGSQAGAPPGGAMAPPPYSPPTDAKSQK